MNYHRHNINADVRSIERNLFTRRPTPIRDVALAIAIGVALAAVLVKWWAA